MVHQEEPDAVRVAAQALHDPIDAVTGRPKTVSTPQSASRSMTSSDAICAMTSSIPELGNKAATGYPASGRQTDGLGQPAGVGGADDQTEEVRMSGTTTGIVVFCVVIVLALAIWLGAVALAARRPYSGNPKRERMRGVVQGGQHMGGGRSVMPTRDAPVPPGGGTRPPARGRRGPSQPPGRAFRKPDGPVTPAV